MNFCTSVAFHLLVGFAPVFSDGKLAQPLRDFLINGVFSRLTERLGPAEKMLISNLDQRHARNPVQKLDRALPLRILHLEVKD
jgi:hypothetical protein